MYSYSPEHWHSRSERIRSEDRADDEGCRLIKEKADDCDLLARRAREKDQARDAIRRLMDARLRHKRKK